MYNNLAEPDYRDTLNYADGFNKDLRETIEKNFPRAVQQTRAFAPQFKGNTARETAHNVWKFIKTHCVYEKDTPDKQCIKLPSRFFHELGHSDCKSFALASASLLANNGLPVAFRYANYRGGSIPSHIYTVTQDENGKEIIVDAVWKYFDSEKKPTSKFDVPMKIYTLSGTEDRVMSLAARRARHPKFWAYADRYFQGKGTTAETEQQKNRKAFHSTIRSLWMQFKVMHKKRNQFNAIMRKRYDGTVSEAINGFESDMQNELGWFGSKLWKGIKKAAGGAFSAIKKVGGAAFKGIKAAGKFAWKIGKKLALAPARQAFRGLVHVNFKGLAQKLKRVNDKDAKALKKKWESLGGSYNSLLSTIRHGYNHWAKNHNKGPMTGLYGIDIPILMREADALGCCALYGEGEDIGAAPVMAIIGLAATILAALAPLLKKHGGNPEAEEAGREASTEDILNAATEGVQAFNAALPHGEQGLSMLDPTDPDNKGDFDFQNGKDDTPDSEAGFQLNLPKILLIGGGLMFALSSGSKRKAA